MDEMDDFGDLYTDFEGHVNAGIPGISAGDFKFKEADSMSVDGGLEARNAEACEKDGEEVNEVSENSWSSDSEDELHIVLNEEDCSKYRAMQRAVNGSGMGMAEEEGQREDQKCAEQQLSGDGMVLTMNGYLGRHIRSYPAGFAVNFKNSTSERSERDLLLMPCTQGRTLCDISSLLFGRSGLDFYLPRTRTIFDFNVEAFERKPWRNHGVDITDFFNFGFDEDSWKIYCNCMDLYREQATLTRIPVSSSTKLSKVLASEDIPTKVTPGEFNCLGQVDTVPSVLADVERVGSGLGKPKGRAIQVESGVGERIPSIDLRRPRHSDSDVVIQITVEDAVEDTSTTSSKVQENVVEQWHVDAAAVISEIAVYDGLLAMDHEGQRSGQITKSGECSPWRMISSLCPVTTLNTGRGIEEIPLMREAASVKSESNSAGRAFQSCNSSDLENHYEASEGDVSWEKMPNSATRASLNSGSGMQESLVAECNHSNELGSDTSKTEVEGRKGFSRDGSIYMGDNGFASKARIQRAVKTYARADGDEDCKSSYKKHQNHVDRLEMSHGTKGSNLEGGDDLRHLSYNTEAEMPLSCKSRRFVGKPARDYDSKDLQISDGHGPYTRRRQELKPAANFSGAKESKHYSHNKMQEEKSFRFVVKHDFVMSNSEHTSFSVEKDQSSLMEKNRDDDWQVRRAGEYEVMVGHRYRAEFSDGVHEKYMTFCDGDEDCFDIKFGQYHQHKFRTNNRGKRSLHDPNSCLDWNSSRRCGENDVRDGSPLARRLLYSQTYLKPHSLHGRGRHSTNALGNHSPNSGRLATKYTDDGRVASINDFQFKYKSENSSFIPSDLHCSPHQENYPSYMKCLDYDDFTAVERSVYTDKHICRENFSRKRPVMQRHCAENDVYIRHQKHFPSSDGSSLSGSLFKNVNGRLDKNSLSGHKVLDDCWLNDFSEYTLTERTEDFDSKAHLSLDLGIFRKKRLEMAARRHEEAVNKQFNGWKGKVNRKWSGLGNNHRDHATGKRNVKLVKWEEVPCTTSKLKDNNPDQTRSNVRISRKGKLEHLDQQTSKLSEKHPAQQFDDVDDDIEEGQLIEERDSQELASTTKNCSSAATTEGKLCARNARSSKSIEGYDPNRILDTLEKMKRRGERFKEQIVLKREPEKSQNQPAVVASAGDEIMQQRPVRKRRWRDS